MEDESICFELDCCPPGTTVPSVSLSRPLFVEVLNVGPYPSPLDSLVNIQTEDFSDLLT